MSGAFETAAGAFAVVGVADVLIRTGRDLYRFLHGILDAPDEIIRLRDIIKEIVYLHEASIKCQNDLKARGAAVGNNAALRSLESASGALSRALQSLKLLVGKFKGAKTWSRVKFVLDESKVKKAISALEQAKVLLANALTLACCEFSALGNANIVTMVRASFDKAGVETKNLLESLETKLDAQFQHVLTTQGQNQKELLAKFDENQHQTLTKQASINQAILSVQNMQMDSWRHQHTGMRQLSGDQKRTSASIQRLSHTVAKAADLDNLSALIKQSLSISHGARQPEPKGRTISFLGERQDQIMAYLLPFRDNINFAIDFVISQLPDKVSIDDAEWLRAEFEHLIGSASQELALQYRNSTATSLDHWSYPEDNVGVFKSAKQKRRSPIACAPPTTLQYDDHHRPESWSRNRPKYSQQKILVPTASGEVTISLPIRRKPIKAPEGRDEVALYYTAEHNRSKFQIRARFLRDLQYASQPRICAHLSVFIELKGNFNILYYELIKDGSLAEIDDALREGTISPFHMNNKGINLLLYYTAYHHRTDVLDYLEAQGIGQSALNHDMSILAALGFIPDEESSTFESAVSRAADVSSFAIQTALMMITCLPDKEIVRQLISKSLEVLQQEGLGQTENEILLDCFAHRDLSQICISLPRLVSLLVEADLSSIDGAFGVSRICELLFLRQDNRYDDRVTVEMLSIFIKGGANVNYVDSEDMTLSMNVRVYQRWDIWCEALQNSGKNIQDVVSKEGNSWLLGDDWKEVWLEHKYSGYKDILSDENDSESSEESDHDGYEEGDSDDSEYDDSDENDDQPYNRRESRDSNHTF